MISCMKRYQAIVTYRIDYVDHVDGDFWLKALHRYRLESDERRKAMRRLDIAHDLVDIGIYGMLSL